MKKEYIIKIKVNDGNRNLGEIIQKIQKWLAERDGIEEVSIWSENEK